MADDISYLELPLQQFSSQLFASPVERNFNALEVKSKVLGSGRSRDIWRRKELLLYSVCIA
jgi:hypothetical protein